MEITILEFKAATVHHNNAYTILLEGGTGRYIWHSLVIATYFPYAAEWATLSKHGENVSYNRRESNPGLN